MPSKKPEEPKIDKTPKAIESRKAEEPKTVTTPKAIESEKAEEPKAATPPQVVESENIVDSAVRERASSKLRYHAKSFKSLLDSIRNFYADASEDARAEAKADLQEVAGELSAFLAE